jgi:hypothetical protein
MAYISILGSFVNWRKGEAKEKASLFLQGLGTKDESS